VVRVVWCGVVVWCGTCRVIGGCCVVLCDVCRVVSCGARRVVWRVVWCGACRVRARCVRACRMVRVVCVRVVYVRVVCVRVVWCVYLLRCEGKIPNRCRLCAEGIFSHIFDKFVTCVASGFAQQSPPSCNHLPSR